MQRLLNIKDWRLVTKLVVAMALTIYLSLGASSAIQGATAAHAQRNQVGEQLIGLSELEGRRIGEVLAGEVTLLKAGIATTDDIVGPVKASNAAYTGSDQEIVSNLLELDTAWQAAPEAGIPLMDEILDNAPSDRLGDYIQQVPAYAEIFVTDRHGALVASTGRTSDYYQADEDWWQASWNNGAGDVYVGPPALDESAGVVAIEIAMPVTDLHSGEIVGVLKAVYNIQAVVDEIGSFELGRTGQAWVIAADGRYVAGSQLTDVGQPVPESRLLDGRIFTGTGFVRKVAEGNEGTLVLSYAPVTSGGRVPQIDRLGWVVQVTQSRPEAFAVTRQSNIIIAVTSLTTTALAILAGFFVSRLVTRQVDEIEKVFRAAAIGEFDARAEVLSRDELGRTAEGVNAMLAQLTDILDVSETARVRAENAVTTLVSTVDQTAISVQVADQATLSAQSGQDSVQHMIEAMERIRDNTQESARRVKLMGEASQEISEVVRLIEELADRTTVLALNASIQAAAAGEAGRGFAVVAEEVQRLAERATSETRRIENLVKNIQGETNEAMVGIEDATREVVEGTQLAQTAGEHMTELSDLVEELAELIQRLASTTAQQVDEPEAAMRGREPAAVLQPQGGDGHGPGNGGVPAGS